MPPEFLVDKSLKRNKESDIWALGVTFYNICSAFIPPFATEQAIKKNNPNYAIIE